MAYSAKQWKNRSSDHLNRRLLTDANTGKEQLVYVTRNEGTIHEEGDAFNEVNMNNLEERISMALDSGKSFKHLTESEFAALSPKDPTVYYMVLEDE